MRIEANQLSWRYDLREGQMLSSFRTATFVALMTVGWTAAAQAQVTTSHLKLKGDAVDATFISLDPTNNYLETAVTVFASQGMQKTSPGQKTTTIATELAVSRIDACIGTPIFEGVGSAEVHDLRVAGDLRTATLTATVPVVDEAANVHLFTVAPQLDGDRPVRVQSGTRDLSG
jgi:hypothetical protein